jgi:hypothetical protein
MNTSPTRNGQWKAEKVMENWHGYADWTTYTVRDARNCCIAVVGEVDHLPAPENADNARIMAAAPRLLAFAELVADFFENDSSGHAQYLREQALNAIAATKQT